MFSDNKQKEVPVFTYDELQKAINETKLYLKNRKKIGDNAIAQLNPNIIPKVDPADSISLFTKMPINDENNSVDVPLTTIDNMKKTTYSPSFSSDEFQLDDIPIQKFSSNIIPTCINPTYSNEDSENAILDDSSSISNLSANSSSFTTKKIRDIHRTPHVLNTPFYRGEDIMVPTIEEFFKMLFQKHHFYLELKPEKPDLFKTYNPVNLEQKLNQGYGTLTYDNYCADDIYLQLNKENLFNTTTFTIIPHDYHPQFMFFHHSAIPSKVTEPKITSISMLLPLSREDIYRLECSNIRVICDPPEALSDKIAYLFIQNMFFSIINRDVTPESSIKDIKQKLNIEGIGLNFNKTLNKDDVSFYIPNKNAVNVQYDVLNMLYKANIPSVWQKIEQKKQAKRAKKEKKIKKEAFTKMKAAFIKRRSEQSAKKQALNLMKVPILMASQKSWLAKRETDVTQLITFIKNLTQSIEDIENLAKKLENKWFQFRIIGPEDSYAIMVMNFSLCCVLADASALKASLNNKFETLSYSEKNASFTKDALNLLHVLENGKANDLKDRLVSIAEKIADFAQSITAIITEIAVNSSRREEKLLVDLAKSFELKAKDCANTAQTAAARKAKKLAQNATQEAVWYSQNNTQLAQIITQMSEIAQNAAQYAKLAQDMAEEQGAEQKTISYIKSKAQEAQSKANEINQAMIAVQISAQLSAQRADLAQQAVQDTNKKEKSQKEQKVSLEKSTLKPADVPTEVKTNSSSASSVDSNPKVNQEPANSTSKMTSIKSESEAEPYPTVIHLVNETDQSSEVTPATQEESLVKKPGLISKSLNYLKHFLHL